MIIFIFVLPINLFLFRSIVHWFPHMIKIRFYVSFSSTLLSSKLQCFVMFMRMQLFTCVVIFTICRTNILYKFRGPKSKPEFEHCAITSSYWLWWYKNHNIYIIFTQRPYYYQTTTFSAKCRILRGGSLIRYTWQTSSASTGDSCRLVVPETWGYK